MSTVEESGGAMLVPVEVEAIAGELMTETISTVEDSCGIAVVLVEEIGSELFVGEEFAETSTVEDRSGVILVLV